MHIFLSYFLFLLSFMRVDGQLIAGIQALPLRRFEAVQKKRSQLV